MNDAGQRLTALILAAGKGTRMQSDLAKVLHPLHNRPMIQYVVETAMAIRSDRIVVIVGHQTEDVRRALKPYRVIFAEQKDQLGTGHAVMQAVPFFEGADDTLLVLAGDTPLLTAATLKKFVFEHHRLQAAVSILTAKMNEPAGFGRIVRTKEGQIIRIVEEKDATDEEREIKEINTSTYCFHTPLLMDALKKIKPMNMQGEYYLTDTIGILRDQGHTIEGIIATDPDETIGINTLAHLATAEAWIEARKKDGSHL